MRKAPVHGCNPLAGASDRCLLAAVADRHNRDGPRSASCGPQPPSSTMQQPLWTRQTWRVHELPSSWRRRSARPVGPNGRARAREPRRRPRMITMGATATRAHCPTARPDRRGQNRGWALSSWSDDSCRCPAFRAADRRTSGRLVALPSHHGGPMGHCSGTLWPSRGDIRSRSGRTRRRLSLRADPWEVPAG